MFFLSLILFLSFFLLLPFSQQSLIKNTWIDLFLLLPISCLFFLSSLPYHSLVQNLILETQLCPCSKTLKPKGQSSYPPIMGFVVRFLAPPVICMQIEMCYIIAKHFSLLEIVSCFTLPPACTHVGYFTHFDRQHAIKWPLPPVITPIYIGQVVPKFLPVG